MGYVLKEVAIRIFGASVKYEGVNRVEYKAEAKPNYQETDSRAEEIRSIRLIHRDLDRVRL